jgi:hypothetical protein
MKKTHIALFEYTLVSLTFIFPVAVDAQKLPNVQEISLRAPISIKIDGKTTEWNNRFRAYNNSTEFFYTIANDDDNVYLAIQATSPDIINKMIKGGVTFTVNSSDKKNDDGGVTITFPFYSRTEGFNINLDNIRQHIRDTIIMRRLTDSFIMNVANKELAIKSKEIRITGIKEFNDNRISVYNEHGNKATSLFDKNIYYNYELAIPIKYLGLSIDDPKRFSYNVKINPTKISQVSGNLRDGIKTITVVNGTMEYGGPSLGRVQYLMSATDFWGEYILSKKN